MIWTDGQIYARAYAQECSFSFFVSSRVRVKNRKSSVHLSFWRRRRAGIIGCRHRTLPTFLGQNANHVVATAVFRVL